MSTDIDLERSTVTVPERAGTTTRVIAVDPAG